MNFHVSMVRKLLIVLCLATLLPSASALAEVPLEVGVALKVNQITSINQKAENFGVVAALLMEWNEPQLAAKAGEQVAPQRIYQGNDFARMMTERHLIWPAHSFYNLQGRVDYQNRGVAVDPDGNVKYIARFTATFQAPDFDFRQFPLDEQYFHLTLDAFPPERLLKFKVVEEFSGLGDALGEEEWILDRVQTEIITHNNFGVTASRFKLSFYGKRHLNYYVVRILVPVMIIILVSWFTFFLKDYTKRIDLASGNLLLFIAFNFTIANDLPRLGYLTLMDTFMLATFAITGLVVLANVWLKRLQNHGRDEFISQLDDIGVWLYPLVYVGGGVLMYLLFHS